MGSRIYPYAHPGVNLADRRQVLRQLGVFELGQRQETAMRSGLGPGFQAPVGKPVDAPAYEQWTGRWSRMFVPMVIAAARLAPGHQVLDVSTGTGEAAMLALQAVGAAGRVIGVDIAPSMLAAARDRLSDAAFG